MMRCRALALESVGYQTKVFELIDQDHTAKNVMISAIKSASKSEHAAQKYEQTKKEFGLARFPLDAMASMNA